MNPDVLVLDLMMPGIDGFEVIRQLNLNPQSATRILAISGDESPEIILRCMRMGVDGLLEKTWPSAHIAAAVEAVAAGSHVFSPEQSRAVQPVLAVMARRSREAKIIALSLTRREREVLDLVVRGHSNRQVARALEIAERTVESHLFGLYGKLGVESRIQAAQRALELRLVDLSPSVADVAGAAAASGADK
jgi:DNA-binding NarL/FixJ family response regulator